MKFLIPEIKILVSRWISKNTLPTRSLGIRAFNTISYLPYDHRALHLFMLNMFLYQHFVCQPNLFPQASAHYANGNPGLVDILDNESSLFSEKMKESDVASPEIVHALQFTKEEIEQGEFHLEDVKTTTSEYVDSSFLSAFKNHNMQGSFA
eukprot:TRINITY_DN3932_c0_g1_i2.p1 TRINITY_DN3932_c0_g1~~TRINITY_DN3932_c0_g1_i2.p1  ORF type:complete len:151 (-),score=15.88 TRINITY_DN3932_c0_g1_i2:203-655(-)